MTSYTEKKLNGTVIVTYRCNARCSMCNRYKAPSKPEEELTIETIRKLPPMYFTNITGGEPFIRTDLPSIVRELYKKSDRIVISTNGGDEMDREKVINCLADIENIMIARQDICPPEELQYWVELQEGVADAISLLKDQQNVISGLKVINDGLCEAVTEQKQIVRCKDCKWAEVSDNEHTWCDHVDHEFCHNNDWFCADGKRRDDDV